MKKILFTVIALVIVLQTRASIKDSLSIGATGGYTNYNTLKGELYFKKDLKVFNRHAEIKAGMNNRGYQLEFDQVKDLKASSIGIFGDVVIYPFNKGIYLACGGN
jgi:hypothetical protein